MGISNERIYLSRKNKGLSIQEISEVLKIEEKRYEQYEISKILKLNEELLAVANALDVSCDYLIGRIDWPIPVITENEVKIMEGLITLSSAENMELVREKANELKN